ncbi:MAG TPA: hypothetical protein VI855_07935 [Dehalococcoidia bacterium]|nr:hypothetical protein [Dehalococcoidia bacterium]
MVRQSKTSTDRANSAHKKNGRKKVAAPSPSVGIGEAIRLLSSAY